MLSRFERIVAWRYLRSKKAEGFVSVIAGFSFAGIMLGVATLIIVMSVMNGFRQELFGRILGLGGHMNVYSSSGILYDYPALSQNILSVPGVKAVTPVIEGQTLLSYYSSASGIIVRGISQADFIARDVLYESIKQGQVENFRGFRIAIGSVLAERLKIKIGDKVTLTSPKLKTTPFGTVPTQRTFEVAMIFDVEMYEYNNGFVFMPLDSAQKFFKYDNGVGAIEVYIQDPEKLDDVRKVIEMEIAGKADIYDWRDLNKSFFNALEVERNVMFLILSLIILVAAFNIISSMIMMVKDKGTDIAVMRTMGATKGNILRIFMLTGASIGFIGTIFGALLGISFALNIETVRHVIEGMTGTVLWDEEIRFLSEIPAVLDWNEVIGIVLMTFTLSIIATIYPSWRAARMDPVEALRYE